MQGGDKLRREILVEIYKEIQNDIREASRNSVMISSFIFPSSILAVGMIIQYNLWYMVPSLSGLFTFFLLWLLGCWFDRENCYKESDIIRNELDRILRDDITDRDFSLAKLHKQIERARKVQERIFIPFMYIILFLGIILSLISFAIEIVGINLTFIISTIFVSFILVFTISFFFYVNKGRSKIFVRSRDHIEKDR